MDVESAAIIAWLREQPPDTVIEWSSDHLSEERPWSTGWVDVWVPALCAHAHMNWAWTIVGPDHEDEEDEGPAPVWAFAVDYDLDVHGVYDPHPPHYWFVEEIVRERGSALTAAEATRLDAALAAGADRSLHVRGGWSAVALSQALTGWAAKHAERADIRFMWNPTLEESPMSRKTRDIIARIESGEGKTHHLGDGMEASEEVMDFFLEDPDRAAKLMRDFKRATGLDTPPTP